VRPSSAWIPCIAIALALASSSSAFAGGDTERARALFDEAGALERQGQWAAAQDRLRAALRLRETPQLYFALGWELENDDKLLEAKAEYDTAIRLGAGRPNAEEAVRLATARLVDLEKKTPVLKLRIEGAGRVYVDGRARSRAL
jgi:tetratricopeptide (TPR) repeat protein